MERSGGKCSKILKSLPCIKRLALATLCFVHIIYASIWNYSLIAWGVSKVEKGFWISAELFMIYTYVFGILISFKPRRHLLTRLTLLVWLDVYYMFILGVLLKLNIESQLNHMKKLLSYMLYNLLLVCVVSLCKSDLSNPASIPLESDQTIESSIELPKTNGTGLSVEPFRHFQPNSSIHIPPLRAEVLAANDTSLRTVSTSQIHRQDEAL